MIKKEDFLPKEELYKYQKLGMKILAYTNHEDDEYFIGSKLTTYSAHVEGLGKVSDGLHVLIFGGEYEEIGEYGESLGYIPAWWFLNDGTFEIAANPILFIPLENL